MEHHKRNGKLNGKYSLSTQIIMVNNMKKQLNVTLRQFNESKYFRNKYGNINGISESGSTFKTDKGNELMFIESAEDDWLDGYLEKHPEAFESLLKWVQKKNPNMAPDAQERFARNILKKKHREGKLDNDSTTPPSGSDQKEEKPTSPTSSEIRTASSEDEERFCKEITNYQTDSKGTVRKERWLVKKDPKASKKELKYGSAKLEWWRPVGFDENGKVLLDKFLGKLEKSDSWKDGDYDDGQQHSWTTVQVYYKVDSTSKVGEDIGELKDGNVVLSDGTVLIGGGIRRGWSWTENDRWWRKPSYGGYGRRRYY